MLLTTAGAMSTPAVLIEPLRRKFGWSTETISVALSARMAVFGLVAPFAAALMLRFGLRTIMIGSLVSYVLEFVLPNFFFHVTTTKVPPTTTHP